MSCALQVCVWGGVCVGVEVGVRVRVCVIASRAAQGGQSCELDFGAAGLPSPSYIRSPGPRELN